MELRPAWEVLKQRGIPLLAIASQSRAGAGAPLGDAVPPFPLLFDEDRIVAYRYGVFRLYDSRRVRVARPATFLVGPDGRIRFVHRGTREQRCPVEKLIEVAADENPPSSRCGDGEGRSPEEV